jgi:hypothetical protein
VQQLITRNSHAIVPHFPISTVGPCFQHRSIRTEVQGAGRRAWWRAFYLCCVRLNGVMCVRMLEPLVKYSDGLVRASRKCCKRLVFEDIARLLARKYIATAHGSNHSKTFLMPSTNSDEMP